MKIIKNLLALSLCLTLLGCSKNKTTTQQPSSNVGTQEVISEDTITDTKDEVALYLSIYQHLPDNYMTKKEARKSGWEGGALHKVVKGKCIGGDVYGNYEGVLPDIPGKYYECDIDTLNSSSRGAKRIIFDDDPKDIDIYYTDDHYESFTLLYGDGEYE